MLMNLAGGYRWPEYIMTVRGEEWTIPWRDDE
jgi:aminobenzoyl-glutamate utilization protein B